MTASEILAACAAAGVEVLVRPDGTPVVRGNPNAALLAALKERRTEVLKLLGSDPPPRKCPGGSMQGKDEGGKWVDLPIPCGTWVYEAVDSDAFCMIRNCPFRREAGATRDDSVPV